MKQLSKKQITKLKVLEALRVLEEYGRSAYDSEVSKGTAIGYSLYTGLDVNQCILASEEALEQWNAHLMKAAIRAIDEGNFDRDGDKLLITLSPEWNEI